MLLAAIPSSARASGCQLGNGIELVVYVEFDYVHFTRDNPNVPSDLEQMPNLLNFIKQNTRSARRTIPFSSRTRPMTS